MPSYPTMSASIDDEVTEGGEDTRAVLASWLDDYSDGRCDLEDMRTSFLSMCRNNPDAPWDALALLDQYTRRGRIPAELAQSLKKDIERLVFGEGRARGSRPRPAAPHPADVQRPSRDATSDLEPIIARRVDDPAPERRPGGEDDSVFRKLIAERDADSTRPGTAFIDRTVLRDEPPLSTGTRTHIATPASPVRQPATPAIARGSVAGRVLRDRYELLSVIGSGSTGAVYRAIDRRRAHLSETARCVAVKVLNGECAREPQALVELEREFHQAQSLSHPNIASVFDLDRDGDTWFVVMELLEGELLSSVLRKLAGRPMRREHAFAIMAAIGAALAYAHRREIVHGDLKPGNVILTIHGEVRVLDFGFARNRPLDLHTASAMHEAPSPSPAYASVERVNGSVPDPSDDVYSFACIAYELLTGQHPFGGRSALHARAHGRRPARVRGLKRKQQQALQRALLWGRGERRINIAELITSLGCAEAAGRLVSPEDVLAADRKGFRWLKVGAWAAAAAAAGAAAFYFGPQLLEHGEAVKRWAAAPAATRADIKPPPAAAAAPDVEDTAPEQGASEPDTAQLASAPAPNRTPAQTAQRGDQVKPEATPRDAASAARPPAGSAGQATIQFDKDTYVATEGDGSVRLLVTRSGASGRPATLTWSLRSNSAEAGSDFAAIGPGVERLGSGVREMSITIPLVSDGVVENTELFLVELEAGDGVSLGERSHAAVIVVDDD